MFASAEEFLSATIGLSRIAMLLDLQLPAVSGLDLQRRLRREGSTLPIIGITAHDDSRVREDAERFGCLAYLAKPCNSSTILALPDFVRQGSSAFVSTGHRRVGLRVTKV
jgi:FixJ family two-component response regulator